MLANIYHSFKRGGKPERPAAITLHTQLVLITTVILIVLGSLGFFLFENDRCLEGMSQFEKVKVCYFQSVTARTCGFHTVDVVNYAPATLFLFMILMFIGGSPGGTAGG
ncbi:MAG: potassium transporter Trk, partial [Planctomycetes bacterium]|nr:potassium transporter Trk [Planctomycetota bacterium]